MMCVKVLLTSAFLLGAVFCDYWDDRSNVTSAEESQVLGSSIVLTEKEVAVNEILMAAKLRELDVGAANQSAFPPAIHFFHGKSLIENSDVFKFIRKLPKGASLHSHSTAVVSFESVLNLTYTPNLYGCYVDGVLQLNFFNGTTDDTCPWRLLSEWREQESQFDTFLKSQLTLVVDDPETRYRTIDEAWDKFNNIFSTTYNIYSYRPLMEEYFRRTLQEFYDDNIQYFEFRGSVGPWLFDLNGTTYSTDFNVEMYTNILEEFKRDHPDFLGAKIIYARGRITDNATLEGYLQTYLSLKETYPDFIAGFDLVGQEDVGELLEALVDVLQNYSGQVDYYFHAGETNWNGLTDNNLIDAVLLGTKRIGHGYAILRHPVVASLVKERDIAIEINPISNQVLKLVDDLRDHTGAHLIAAGYPVVISCDDPGLWGAKGLSYDWYMAFMGMTSRNGDLKILKQLALNSIRYSSLDSSEEALAVWQSKWEEFLDDVINGKVI